MRGRAHEAEPLARQKCGLPRKKHLFSLFRLETRYATFEHVKGCARAHIFSHPEDAEALPGLDELRGFLRGAVHLKPEALLVELLLQNGLRNHGVARPEVIETDAGALKEAKVLARRKRKS